MGLKDKKQYNEYMRKYMLERYHKRLKESKDKFGNICSKCENTNQLEFDHIDSSTKTFTIVKMWYVSEEKFAKELSKCQLLCKNCHIEKHRSSYHCGTPQRYWTGCRCSKCTKANTNHNREYKKKRSFGATG